MTASGLALLRRPIWLAGALVAVLAAAGFARLGTWQLDRHAERRDFNAALAAAEEAPPAPLGAVLASPDPEYRRATVGGEYVPGTTVLLQSRSYRGSSGFHVLDALDTGSGPVVVVDRGWVPLTVLEDPDQVAPPPPGPVVVEGRVRVPRREGAVSPARDGLPPRIAAVDPDALGELWQREVLPAYVELAGEQPEQGAPIPADAPSRGAGPHLSYAFQWFAFAVIAVAGFAALAYRTARRPPPAEREPAPAGLR